MSFSLFCAIFCEIGLKSKSAMFCEMNTTNVVISRVIGYHQFEVKSAAKIPRLLEMTWSLYSLEAAWMQTHAVLFGFWRSSFSLVTLGSSQCVALTSPDQVSLETSV